MARIRTHYDNLKVSRDAPIEVIRAAYKSSAAKYHPDLNSGDLNATEIMRIINSSYEVLSDPETRAEHDRWIATLEGPERGARDEYGDYVARRWRPGPGPAQWSTPQPKPQPTPVRRGFAALIKSTFPFIILLLIVTGWIATVVSNLATDSTVAKTTGPTERHASGSKEFAPSELRALPPASVSAARPRYERPILAPNGNPWPSSTGYIAENSEGGNSAVTVDNTQNGSNMLVKLFDHRFKRPAAVRMIFLRAHEEFTFENVEASGHDIRYQDLDSGVISKSQTFNLEESQEDIQLPDRVRHVIHNTKYRLTLYKVLNGNTNVEVIGPDDF